MDSYSVRRKTTPNTIFLYNFLKVDEELSKIKCFSKETFVLESTTPLFSIPIYAYGVK